MNATFETGDLFREYTLENAAVWLLNLRELSEEDFDKMYALCSNGRKEKADRIKAPRKRKQSIGAGYLLDRLKKRFSIEEEPVVLSGGKPVFRGNKELCFNISHSGDYAALAFGKEALGMDLEQVKRADLKVAKRFFQKEEYEYLADRKEEERADAFCRIWTGKEAVLKAAGTGLCVPLAGFSVLGKTPDDPVKEGCIIRNMICHAEKRYELYQWKFVEEGRILWISTAVLHEF